MASINSLLNPLPDLHNRRAEAPNSSPLANNANRDARSMSPFPHPSKKPKMPKDAPIFTKGPVRGEVRYPPHEDQDPKLAGEHEKFNIHPMGEIGEYPRHIPYNSDKKSFLERTGRESFEVFQYTFRMPGEEREWVVMWDYNIGLMRTTHLFKCNDYSKTTPAKMLNANPGLRDVCHSITGGALAAQGYWMPFEAAKAVATTFCWKIRYALTPVFGRDFPASCVHPNDPHYGKMIISPDVVQRATESANHYRALELRSKLAATVTNTITYGASPRKILPSARSGQNARLLGRDRQGGNVLVCTPSPPPSSSSNDFTPINSSTRHPPQGKRPVGRPPRNAAIRDNASIPSPREILESISNSGIPSKKSAVTQAEAVEDDSSDDESTLSHTSDKKQRRKHSGAGGDANDRESANESDLEDGYISEDDEDYINDGTSSLSLSDGDGDGDSDSDSDSESSDEEGERTPSMRTRSAAAARRKDRKTRQLFIRREVDAAQALLDLHTGAHAGVHLATADTNGEEMHSSGNMADDDYGRKRRRNST